MFKKLILFLVLYVSTLIAGCGGASNDGSTALFETASVSFVATPLNVNATVTIPNTDDATTVVPLKITVKAYPGATVSPFTVRNMKYTYTQIEGGTLSFFIPDVNFDTSLSFKPVLASAEVKDKVVSLGFVSGFPWKFNVQAIYTVVEDFSGKTHDYSVPLGSIRFN